MASRIGAAVHAHRTAAGMSLSELARRADVAKSGLSQLESGRGNPGVETVWALATALGVPFSALIDPTEPEETLVRAGEGEATRADAATYAAVVLSHSPAGVRRDLYRIDAEPSPARVSDPHAGGTVEHVVVVTGRARVGRTEDPVELGAGDYLRYPGDVPHLFEALEPGTSAVLVSQQV
ncbi:XRE family transcriptional regulator [Marmoricola endophyticus]|uniref:XRE family transcriptional regulator n=1 Tax=Marmoricola endophyticus TaxID=2040280 RepID=A0A917BIG1_9ACTN|nr:XRE family transcriptional regulator [Marmoricola endophyticus]GGF45281.1 XRE family transcriptional regulator [Marmoricola endophyticus]